MAVRHGKQYQAAASKVDRSRDYSPEEAVALVKDTSYTKFDATVEAHLRLGIDPRHADQQVRSTVSLPHGSGKRVRIAVFAQGEAAR
ncbi:MAG TPA: 50S ribosomal protein L1, partial [Herpetosiphonaceae bacterium]|nr:50S ribosomal protein L1 [Herpetosiphonaceae bacterium]